MTLMQNIGFWCLVVTVALLLLRVWRLEGKVSQHRRELTNMLVGHNRLQTWRWGQLDTEEVVDFTKRHVASLARALGYEWKRTDAKEGWERKKGPFDVDWKAAGEAWDAAYVDDLAYSVFGINRRKGERRKPAPKKPRRAH